MKNILYGGIFGTIGGGLATYSIIKFMNFGRQNHCKRPYFDEDDAEFFYQNIND